jgi:hypothetical protein
VSNRIRYDEQFELCYLRHKYLEKSQHSLTREELNKYIVIIKKIAGHTFYSYNSLFISIGFDYDDLVNICQIHLVSFLGLFSLDKMNTKYEEFISFYLDNCGRPPLEFEIQNKDKANFTLFLKQRIQDLVRICRQKARNIKGLQTTNIYAFYGSDYPPEPAKLLENHTKYNFRKIEYTAFRTIRKRAKQKDKEMFQYENMWYVCIPAEHFSLSFDDLVGAGLDPRDNLHYQTPETLLIKKQEEEWLQKKKDFFYGQSEEKRDILIKRFIQRHKNDKNYKEEVSIARKYLKNGGLENVDQ